MKLKIDSRKINKGDTFVSVRDDNKYVSEAIKNGATKVVVESGIYDVETLVVDDVNKYIEDYLEENYYDEIKDIKLIGVTGTNGKTTTSYLIYEALNKLGVKCAYIGTIGFYTPKRVEDTLNTTPTLYEIYEMLLECIKEGIEYVSMEVSSHGLDMGRVNGLEFEYGIFTNLTEDHLDYHKTMENYALAKQKLFKQCNNKIINIDDKYKDYFLNRDSITYGKDDCDYKISDINISSNGSSFKLNNEEYNCKLIGEYNIYNMTCVIIVLKLMGLNTNVIKELSAPKGRMEIIPYKSNTIIIDYAHTPDAVEKILTEVSKLLHNKIITMIGCGGDRDKFKRPIMGDIATKYSDFVIFTTDNPRGEKPKRILKDITCKLYKKNYKIITKRKKAIKKCIQKLRKGDILLLLGKGHEEYQIIKNKKIFFSDKEEVLKFTRR